MTSSHPSSDRCTLAVRKRREWQQTASCASASLPRFCWQSLSHTEIVQSPCHYLMRFKGVCEPSTGVQGKVLQKKRKRKDVLMTTMDRMHTCFVVCRVCKASRSNKNEEHALTSKMNTHSCTYLSYILIFQCRTTLKALGLSKHECGSNSSS